MKTKLLKQITLLALLSIVSVFAQKQQKVKGSGNVVSQDRPIGEFTELHLDGIFNVFISQGDKPSVKVEADDNLQAFIKVDMEGNKLKITDENEENIKKFTKMSVYVTVREIEKLYVDMVGDVVTKDTLNSSIFRFISDESTGKTELNIVTTNLSIESKSLGDLKLAGSAEKLDISYKGIGNIDAFKLKAVEGMIQYSGVGDIDVNVTGNISITSSGTGHVAYKGGAVVTKSEATNTGTIKKVK
jgi:hypothetical protein